MKLNDIITEFFDSNKEKQTIRNAPATGNTGDLITAAQAARILDVSTSRIRQMVGSGDLKSIPPAEGQRDHLFKISDVKAYKSKMKGAGRPEGSTEK